MAVREVITVGDKRLREKSRDIEDITPEIDALIEDMIETMHASGGVGLAGVQVAELMRLIVVETPEDEEQPNSGKLYVVINPEIVEESDETELGIEGCLSIPGYVGEVERRSTVTVQGLDRQGRRQRIRVEGYLARVFQHEIDHTEGVLYVDRLTGLDRLWTVEEGEEEQVEAEQARV